jgi:hypothetical protein
MRDKQVRELVSWHDQGCLIWAIQQTGSQERVRNTNDWNLCVDNTKIGQSPIPFEVGFLDSVRRMVPEASILHWNGCSPPWHSRVGLGSAYKSTLAV